MLEVKNTMAVWVQNGCKCISFRLDGHMADKELQLARCLPGITREYRTTHIASLGKDKNFKIQGVVSIECVLILHHHTVEKS